jgi:hypothetical protein
MKKQVSTTSIDHFYEPDTQRTIRHHEEIVFAILTAAAPDDMTLKEIACRFNEWTGYAVPDSSLCAPLNTLKAKGKIADTRPKRACRVNGILKKVWSLIDNPSEETADDPRTADAFASESALLG